MTLCSSLELLLGQLCDLLPNKCKYCVTSATQVSSLQYLQLVYQVWRLRVGSYVKVSFISAFSAAPIALQSHLVHVLEGRDTLVSVGCPQKCFCSCDLYTYLDVLTQNCGRRVYGAQIEAKMTEPLAQSDGARDASERMIALGRLGQAGDVGRALEFLLHPANSYITGAAVLGVAEDCAW